MKCDVERCRNRATVIVDRGRFPCDEKCGCKYRLGHAVKSYLCARCAALLTTSRRPAA